MSPRLGLLEDTGPVSFPGPAGFVLLPCSGLSSLSGSQNPGSGLCWCHSRQAQPLPRSGPEPPQPSAPAPGLFSAPVPLTQPQGFTSTFREKPPGTGGTPGSAPRAKRWVWRFLSHEIQDKTQLLSRPALKGSPSASSPAAARAELLPAPRAFPAPCSHCAHTRDPSPAPCRFVAGTANSSIREK